MKSILSLALFMLVCLQASAQTKPKPKPKTPVAVKTVAAPPKGLTNLQDSASYALGVNIAQSLQVDLGDLNTQLMLEAMRSTFAGKKPLMDEAMVHQVLTQYSEKVKEDAAQAVIRQGEAFLTRNKTQPGIHTTASGLQYQIIKEGHGSMPGPADTVVCNYKGTLTDSTEFDNSYSRGTPLTIPVTGVIKGWTEGLQLMKQGATYRFFIPYELGYGLRGAPPTIPGGSVLVFEIELLEVKKGANPS